MVPLLTEEQLNNLTSNGEAYFYRACRDSLGDSWTVLYSVSWINRQPKQHTQDGETDFVMINRNVGVLVVEVKSGGIVYNAVCDQWISCDYYENRHVIKNPFKQARQAMYSILEKLKEDSDWARLTRKKINIGYAVVLPDAPDKKKLTGPDRPQGLIADKIDLASLRTWALKVLNWWRNEDSTIESLSQGQMAIILKTFARSFSARPLISQRLDEEEEQRITLTMQQGRILRALGSRRRALIKGGAGTGKTVLALEKARSLAKEGFRTLLLCFNRPLGVHLRTLCESEKHVLAGSFHWFAADYIRRIKERTHTDYVYEAETAYPGANFYDIQLPYAFALAAEVKKEPIDALIIDEGQDFRPEYWLPLELLLDDSQLSPLYIFCDSNQAIYAKQRWFPISPTDEFELTINCRNTRAIHEAAYKYYRGSPVDPPEISGVAIIQHGIRGMEKQAEAISNLISLLLTQEGVSPESISVLIVDPLLKQTCQEMLSRKALPNRFNWSNSPLVDPGKVRVESVHRFKGLEVPIGILWGFENIDPGKDPELIYVGLSRPISELHLVGDQESCMRILGGKKQNI